MQRIPWTDEKFLETTNSREKCFNLIEKLKKLFEKWSIIKQTKNKNNLTLFTHAIKTLLY